MRVTPLEEIRETVGHWTKFVTFLIWVGVLEKKFVKLNFREINYQNLLKNPGNIIFCKNLQIFRETVGSNLRFRFRYGNSRNFVKSTYFEKFSWQ